MVVDVDAESVGAIRTEGNAFESHEQRHVSICAHTSQDQDQTCARAVDAMQSQLQRTSNDINIPCLGALDIRNLSLGPLWLHNRR